MTNDNRDQIIRDVMDSPLVRQIIANLNPNPTKLREAVEASLKAIALEAEEEAVKDFGAAGDGLAGGEFLAVWGTDSEADRAAVAKEKEVVAELSDIFYKLQAVATPGELCVIFEDNAWGGFAEVVKSLRRHGVRFSI